MRISVDNIEFNVLIEESNLTSDKIPLVCLHGFTGSALDWQFLSEMIDEKFYVVAIDLLGHGDSSCPENVEFYSADKQNMFLSKILTHLKIAKFFLLGYSMGGRAALSFALEQPEGLLGLILESSSPGLQLESERTARQLSDINLMEMIEKKGIGVFTEYWQDLPIFRTQKIIGNNKLEEIYKRKLDNNPVGLINSLFGFGTGSMPNYWDKIKELKTTLLITGEFDEKFSSINSRMQSLIDCDHEVIKSAGHNVHLEKPDEFIILLNKFLRQNIC